MIKIKGDTAAQIADHIRSLISKGELRPGDLLPPMRELAVSLAVNRNTVAAAYQRLVKGGMAKSRGRHGTLIAAPPKAGELEGRTSDTALIDLADGNPRADWLPDLSTLPLRLPGPVLYGDATVLPALATIAHGWFKPDCPINYEVEVTHGAIDAMERLVAVWLAPGDRVAVEDPCYLGTINALRLAGMRAVGVRMDAEGMLPSALDEALRSGVKAVQLTPRAQNPTGSNLSKPRAAALKKILSTHPDVLVIVDDHFSLLCESPYYSIVSSTTGAWALIRSVSKTLGPDLRLALVACDPGTAVRLRARLAPGTMWVSHILQTIATTCLASSEVRKRIRLAGADYRRRAEVLRKALQRQGINAWPSEGLNVWVPTQGDPKSVAFELAKKGWLVRSSEAFDVQERSNAIRITISSLEEDQALAFAADLGRALQ